MQKIERTANERIEELTSLLTEARLHSAALARYYASIKDKDNEIRFKLTLEILHDLESNIENAKVDTQ